MQQGKILKSTNLSNDDLLKINQYTRRALTQDEIYAFNVLLCDNEVDRDNEAFTVSALEKLKDLFLGKTGIFDHNPKGENQTARIFDTEVVTDLAKKTAYGEAYVCLKAKAYMVRSPKTENLILEIDAGIKKEVSVGCSVAQKTCSVCGADLHTTGCEHRFGVRYNNVLCFGVLDCPTDAYEWSFVAVPAQRGAGVTKDFNKGGQPMLNRTVEELEKAWEQSKEGIALSSVEMKTLSKQWKCLEEQADLGKAYLKSMQERVAKLAFLCGEKVEGHILTSVTQKMSLEELKAFEKAYESCLNTEEEETKHASLPQLYQTKPSAKQMNHDGFKI